MKIAIDDAKVAAESLLGARVGLSMLSNLNLAELAAESAEEFVAIASDLAGDLDRLEG